jgi:hypothetical protein
MATGACGARRKEERQEACGCGKPSSARPFGEREDCQIPPVRHDPLPQRESHSLITIPLPERLNRQLSILCMRSPSDGVHDLSASEPACPGVDCR